MTKHATASMFRKFERMHDEMMRAVMPTVAAVDPTPATTQPRAVAVLAERHGVRLVKPLTFTLAEVR